MADIYPDAISNLTQFSSRNDETGESESNFKNTMDHVGAHAYMEAPSDCTAVDIENDMLEHAIEMSIIPEILDMERFEDQYLHPDVLEHARVLASVSGDSSDFKCTCPMYQGSEEASIQTKYSEDYESTNARVLIASVSGDSSDDFQCTCPMYQGSGEASFQTEDTEDYLYLSPVGTTSASAAYNVHQKAKVAIKVQNDAANEDVKAKQNNGNFAIHIRNNLADDDNWIDGIFQLTGHFVLSLGEYLLSIAIFMFLQVIMAVVKKYDPTLVNFFSCLAYNACYYSSVAFVVWICWGLLIIITDFVIEIFVSNYAFDLLTGRRLTC